MASPATIRPALSAACRATTGILVRPALPPLASPPTTLRAAGLSTTAALLKRHTYEGARKTADRSKKRGESALRRTGPRWKLSVSDEPLPRPVRDLPPPPANDADHGLWGFFQDRDKVALGPLHDSQHGRAWMVEELRGKSWEDLHALWWVCVKERNRLATAKHERESQQLGYGENEILKRDKTVHRTMRAIKHVLTERHYAWEDAVDLAKTDPEIDMSGQGAVFTPSSYLEAAEDLSPEEEAKQAALRRLEAAALADKKAAAAAAAAAASEPEQKGQSEAPRI